MFGNKKDKKQRLSSITQLIRGSLNGKSLLESANDLNVSPGTITKDMGVVEETTGFMLFEENGRYYWSEYNDN